MNEIGIQMYTGPVWFHIVPIQGGHGLHVYTVLYTCKTIQKRTNCGSFRVPDGPSRYSMKLSSTLVTAPSGSEPFCLDENV